jgi:hypothetical protein
MKKEDQHKNHVFLCHTFIFTDLYRTQANVLLTLFINYLKPVGSLQTRLCKHAVQFYRVNYLVRCRNRTTYFWLNMASVINKSVFVFEKKCSNRLLPILISMLFGLLAYQTIPLVWSELNKQLTIIVLIRVVSNFRTKTPYVIVNIDLQTFRRGHSEHRMFVR